MADDLSALAGDLRTLLDQAEPLQHAVGQFGKETATDVVQRQLGADRSLSGMRRRVRLSAGYDTGSPVVLNLRPAGLWTLADKGRRRRGKITPRRRGGFVAVMTPRGPRASSSSTPSRGLNVVRDTERDIDAGVERAAADALGDLIARKGY